MRVLMPLTLDQAERIDADLRDRLGIRPDQITAEGITATYHGGREPVLLTWHGQAQISVAEWVEVLDAVGLAPADQGPGPATAEEVRALEDPPPTETPAP